MIDDNGKKKCSRCKRVLATNEFNNRKSSPDGLYSQCRECACEVRNRSQQKRIAHGNPYPNKPRARVRRPATKENPKSIRVNLAGLKFGKLTAISPNGTGKGGETMWLCECECGNQTTVSRGNLKKLTTRSCGCLKFGLFKIEHGRKVKHGRNDTTEHRIWRGMKQRCLNSKDHAYKHYGGRGITICQRWLDNFQNFFDDMGPRPTSKHSIDRIDNDGNYEPGNCKWSTPSEQNSNQRRSMIYRTK